MNARTRAVLFWVCAIAVLGFTIFGSTGLTKFGAFSGAYSARLLDVAVNERHVYNIATAVNFDYRGFDTMGEEYIFFTSIVGVLFMLSSIKSATKPYAETMESPAARRQTGAIRWMPTGLTAFIAALAMDVGAHGQLTPGGGFQGGAIFGSAIACIYLGVGLGALMKVARKELFDALEALGSFSFASLGVATGAVTGFFLDNILPLGKTGALVSAGSIYFISCAVFVEIACGFSVLVLVFVKQTHQVEEPE